MVRRLFCFPHTITVANNSFYSCAAALWPSTPFTRKKAADQTILVRCLFCSLYIAAAPHRRGRIDHVRQYFYLRYTLLYKTLVVFFAVIYAQNAAQCTGQHPNSHFGDELTAKVKAKKDEREQHQDHHQCGAR